MSKLDEYLNKYVYQLVEDSPKPLIEQEIERHKIYSLLLMSMVAYCWNGNKKNIPKEILPSTEIDYGINLLLSDDENFKKRGKYLSNDYLGHNIAAFAVDREGYIIDFDFNHNQLFNNSTQHAEARLLQRLFSLNQIHDSWNIGAINNRTINYGQALQGVSIYTSLESCAQCSGIMTLGNVKEVIFLQEDPGQYKIGNIMYRLTESNDPQKKALAPRPIAAKYINFPYYSYLAEKFEEHKSKKYSQSITDFLCTEAAYKIFLQAEEDFYRLCNSELKFANWAPTIPNESNSKINSPETENKGLTNQRVLEECQSFYKYFVYKGKRGTPHL